MISEILVLHRPGSAGFEFGAPESAAHLGLDQLFLFNTCMRKIAVLSLDDFALVESGLRAGDEVYRGDDGYRFLLEVTCGLRSPLIGETEVAGQFRNAVSAYAVPSTPWGRQFSRMAKNLFEDVKRVRQAHLVDLGSQSYGSILRRELKGLKQVHVLGAGHLAQEILPWLAKEGTQVHVHARSLEKARIDFGGLAGLHIHSLEERAELAHAQAIVIAAPVRSAWFQDWVPYDATPAIVADLRGDSREDQITGFGHVLPLDEFVNRISSNQAHLEARKAQALAEIENVVLERSRHVEYRPFGWEDVCA
jgi:glutamyl-tRNA reductase